MTWEYRVVRRESPGEHAFGIHEIYYEDDVIKFWSANPISPHGDTLDELAADLAWMTAALEKPILDAADLPGYSG